MKKYTSIKVSNIEDYLAGALGNKNLSPILQLHSAIPSIIIDGKVEQWLVISEYENEGS